MQESGSKNNPAFLEDVFKLNKGSKLGEALTLSLKRLNEIDVNPLNRIVFRKTFLAVIITIQGGRD